MSEWGHLLRKCRATLRHTQKQCAAELSEFSQRRVDQPRVSNLERGITAPQWLVPALEAYAARAAADEESRRAALAQTRAVSAERDAAGGFDARSIDDLGSDVPGVSARSGDGQSAYANAAGSRAGVGDAGVGVEDGGVFHLLAGEPLLGPRQGALVDSVIQRLGGGPAFSEHDVAALANLRRLLGLEER